MIAIAVLAAAPAAGAEASPRHTSSGGLYVALGDSVAPGYAGLLFSHYQSTLGVTAESFHSVGTSGDRVGIDRGVADINAASDTRAVTIDVGGNDRYVCADSWDSCPFRDNFAAGLADLKAALAADPGPEAFAAMAYYNPASREGGLIESYYDRGLLGSDLKIDCDITSGREVGINDIIFQEAASHGAGVANAYPAFKAGGQSLMSGDGIHPNRAGYAAIADAFLHQSVKCGPAAAAPKTTITDSPKHRTQSHGAIFAFRSSRRHSTFECKLDRRHFKPCRSPKTYRHLKPGRHTFQVRATGRFGKTDPSPARWRWKLKP